MTDVHGQTMNPGGRIRSWFHDHPLAGDGLLSLLVLSITIFFTLLNRAIPGYPSFSEPQFWIWAVIGVIPVLIRRLRPWWAAPALACAIMLSSLFTVDVWISISYGLYVVAYTVAAQLTMKPALITTVVLWGVVTALTSITPADQLGGMDHVSLLTVNYVTATITFAIGRSVYSRRQKVKELYDRAQRAETSQATMVAEAINSERRRIARELHDVVAHHISVMNVMATGARRMLTKDPEKADEALSTIETTGRATLREMRRLLDVLRTVEETADEEISPQPGLDAIHTLVSQVRSAGLPTKLTIEGEPVPLDPGISLAVYRVVQESLTNALKHAGMARAGVRLVFDPQKLSVEISDNGIGQRVTAEVTDRIGHGLVGMRERVALYGGTLRTGPRPGGGFRVSATIPLETAPESSRLDGGTR